MLIAIAGLPGAGKSALANALGRELRAPVLAVDAVEAAIWRAGVGGADQPDVPTGLAAYGVVQMLAGDLLEGGHTVIVDAVNAVEPARRAFRELAAEHAVPVRWLEVVCSDSAEHRRRLEQRGQRYAGFTEPTWAEVLEREVEPWGDARAVLDSVRPLAQLVPEALAFLARPADDGDGMQ